MRTRMFEIGIFVTMLMAVWILWEGNMAWAGPNQSPERQTVPTRVVPSPPPPPPPTTVQTQPTVARPTLPQSPTSSLASTPLPASLPLSPTSVLTPAPPLVIPLASLTQVPSPTPTPVPTSALEVAKRPLPSALYNKILFQAGPRSAPAIWVMDPDGSNVGLLTQPDLYTIAKARDTFSPGFIQVAYNAVDPNGILQIWSQDLYYPQSLPQQLSFLRKGYAFGPAWSPDGKKVAYVVNDGALFPMQEIYVWDGDAKKSLRLTDSTGYATGYGTGWWWNQFPSWSPDGKQIVYSSDRGHDATFSEIWIMNADGTNPHNIGNGVWDAYNPVWVKGQW
jgi:WD40-like Beta Propeller Repeat